MIWCNPFSSQNLFQPKNKDSRLDKNNIGAHKMRDFFVLNVFCSFIFWNNSNSFLYWIFFSVLLSLSLITVLLIIVALKAIAKAKENFFCNYFCCKKKALFNFKNGFLKFIILKMDFSLMVPQIYWTRGESKINT